MVPRKGLEPSRLASPTPEAGVSTNFTTWANQLALRPRTINIGLWLVNHLSVVARFKLSLSMGISGFVMLATL